MVFALVFVQSWTTVQGQKLELLFIGDVMGHDAQINSAYDSAQERFDYQEVFKPLSPIIGSADYARAILEVTLAGALCGYPKFSSPDDLAVALKTSGVDALVTANNHSCDRGLRGVVRTLDVLDSLGIDHTGIYRNPEEQVISHLCRSTKTISVSVLTTYGTNGMPIPKGTVVNLIDTLQMADIKRAKAENHCHLVVFMH